MALSGVFQRATSALLKTSWTCTRAKYSPSAVRHVIRSLHLMWREVSFDLCPLFDEGTAVALAVVDQLSNMWLGMSLSKGEQNCGPATLPKRKRRAKGYAGVIRLLDPYFYIISFLFELDID